MPKARKGRGKKRKRKGEKRKKKSCVDPLSDFYCDPSKVPKEMKPISGETSIGSSSSLPNATTSSEHDVFLSFRGLDIRNTFISHLHAALESDGYSVYLDEKSMNEGEEINEHLKRAIENSRICMPVFSQNYAESKACLNELCHMVKCRKKIIPIFYDVEPDVVGLKEDRGKCQKKITPIYRNALDVHRGTGNVKPDKIAEWEQALKKVSSRKGHVLHNKKEADEINCVIKNLVDIVKPKLQDLSTPFIDVDDKKEVMKLSNSSPDEWQIIGIYGLGGIGKTTLVKAVYNELYLRFERSCFLENVREKLEGGRHCGLQEHLCKEIMGSRSNPGIIDENDGRRKLRWGLENKKNLLVFDDINDEEQLEKLIGNVGFARGSRIIVTTRNKEILQRLEQKFVKVSYHKVEGMKDRQARELFCRFAFKADSPPREYENFTNDVISYAGGIPLALRLIGSRLNLYKKDVWEKILEELRTCQEPKMEKIMMMSYEALNENRRNIFLDIANYHGDLHKGDACSMWEDCKWNPDESLDFLIKCSLINYIYEGQYMRLHMHDILKDFGRNIVRKESKERDRPPSRLCINGSLDDLRDIKLQACVETLSISNATIKRTDMKGLCKLRFLELSHCKVRGKFKGSFPMLRWLSLDNPPSYELTNLYWKGWSTIEADKLKVLRLDGYECDSRLKVPKFLNDWIGKLTSLCKLEITGLQIIELPDSIKLLEQLKELQVYGCYTLEKVSDLPLSLTHLYLWDVSCKMQVVWSNQFKLTNIIELEICCDLVTCVDYEEGNHDLSFEWIRGSKNLKKLCLCLPYYIITDLENVVDSALEHLHICYARFQRLEHLPSSLLHLEINWCEIPNGIHLPSSLLHLGINDSKFPNVILDVSNLKDLEHLEVSDLTDRFYGEGEDDGLVEIKGLGESLHILDLSWSSTLRNVHALGALNELESLKLFDCKSLKCVPNLSRSTKLKHVHFWSCPSLELGGADLSKLENAQNMAVDISHCNKLPTVLKYNS